jgi:hypothetical protein
VILSHDHDLGSVMPKFRVPIRCDLSDIDAAGTPDQSESQVQRTNSPTLDDIVVVHYHGGLGTNSYCSGPMRLSSSGLTYSATQSTDAQKHNFVFNCSDMKRFQFARPFNPNVDNQLNVIMDGKNQTFVTVRGIGSARSAGFENLEEGVARLCKSQP